MNKYWGQIENEVQRSRLQFARSASHCLCKLLPPGAICLFPPHFYFRGYLENLLLCNSSCCEEISLFLRDAKNHVEHEEEIIKGSVVVRSELGWMAERVMECPGLFV